jgi:hypothetical protein
MTIECDNCNVTIFATTCFYLQYVNTKSQSSMEINKTI